MPRVRFAAAAAMATFTFVTYAAAVASAALPEFEKTGFFSATGGETTIESSKEGIAIKCKKTAIPALEGLITAVKSLRAGIKLSSCSVFGILAANSVGDASGVILANVLGKLCWINEATKDVGVLLRLEPAVTVEVIGKLITLSGSMIGLITPFKEPTAEFKLKLKQTAGKQDVKECSSEGISEPASLLMTINFEAGEAGWGSEMILKYENLFKTNQIL